MEKREARLERGKRGKAGIYYQTSGTVFDGTGGGGEGQGVVSSIIDEVGDRLGIDGGGGGGLGGGDSGILTTGSTTRGASGLAGSRKIKGPTSGRRLTATFCMSKHRLAVVPPFYFFRKTHFRFVRRGLLANWLTAQVESLDDAINVLQTSPCPGQVKGSRLTQIRNFSCHVLGWSSRHLVFFQMAHRQTLSLSFSLLSHSFYTRTACFHSIYFFNCPSIIITILTKEISTNP